MPETNVQIESLIGVTKTYFIAQKCKKKNTAGGNELMFHC